MRTKKGFSLIELIIVLAIIGILLAILIPSWGYYMSQARYKAQNSKAKIIFNAAQSKILDISAEERKYVNQYIQNGETSALNNIYTHVPTPMNDSLNNNKIDTPGWEWYYYWDGQKGMRVDADGNKLASGATGYTTSTAIDRYDVELGREIMKILDDTTVYKIYVKDYQVQSVVCSRFANDRFIGSYPMSINKIRDMDGLTSAADDLIDEVTDNQKVKGANPMTLFDSDTLDLTT